MPRSRLKPWETVENWSGSHVEAGGAGGKEGARRIPAKGAGTSERRCQTPLLPRAPRVALFLALTGVIRSVEMARISTLRSRLGQGQKHQQRDPLQDFNTILGVLLSSIPVSISTLQSPAGSRYGAPILACQPVVSGHYLSFSAFESPACMLANSFGVSANLKARPRLRLRYGLRQIFSFPSSVLRFQHFDALASARLPLPRGLPSMSLTPVAPFSGSAFGVRSPARKCTTHDTKSSTPPGCSLISDYALGPVPLP